MDPTFWTVVTAVGVFVTAVVTAVFGYLQSRNTTLYNLPTLAIRHDKLMDGSVWIDFQVKSVEGRPDWDVGSITVCRNWRRRRLLCDGTLLCAQGDPRLWSPMNIPFDYKDQAPWRQRLVYDPPVTRGIVLIHAEAPPFVSLRFTVCLSSSPRKRSSIVKRYAIH